MRMFLCLGGVCVLLALAFLGGSGCAGSPPTRLERSLFDVETNQVPVAELVQPTNGSAPYWVTNVMPVYNFKPGAGARAATDAATGVGNLAGGFGGVAGLLAGGVFGVWAHLRSRRYRQAAEAVVEGLEVARATLRAAGMGGVDERLVRHLATEQGVRGVREDVRRIRATKVDPLQAKAAGEQILATAVGR